MDLSLQGGFNPQTTAPQPTLQDHANTLFQLGLNQPVGSPERTQHLLTGLQLAQVTNQNQQNQQNQLPAPDAYLVHAQNGKTYSFQDPKMAAQFKAQYGIPDPQPSGNFGSGFGKGLISSLQGLTQGLNTLASPVTRLISGIAGKDLGNTNHFGYDVPQEALAPVNGERLGYIAGSSAPYVVAGGITGPVAATASVPQAMALEGTAQGLTGLASTQGDIGQRLEAGTVAGLAGAGGAGLAKVVGPIIKTTAPKLSSFFSPTVTGSTAEDVFSAGTSITSKRIALRNALGDEMGAFSKELTDQFQTPINLTPDQVAQYQQALKSAGLQIPDYLTNTPGDIKAGFNRVEGTVGGQSKFMLDSELNMYPRGSDGSINLTISQAQNLGRVMNEAYQKAIIEPAYDDLRSTITTQLNQAHPGLGTVYDQMYLTATQGYDALNTAFSSFSDKSVNPEEVFKGVSALQKLSQDPNGQPVIASMIDKLKAQGIDVTNETKMISQIQKIKDPLAKRAAVMMLKILKTAGYGGLAIGGAHEILK